MSFPIASLRNNFWRETSNHFTTIRDAMCTFGLFSLLHIGAFTSAYSSADSHCLFSEPWFLPIVGLQFALCTLSLLQRSSGAWGILVDVCGVPIGLLFQIVTRPSAWPISLASTPDDCTVTENPVAMHAFALSDILWGSTVVRLVMIAFSRFESSLSRILSVTAVAATCVVVGAVVNLTIEAV